MSYPQQYWHLYRISLQRHQGYHQIPLPTAQTWLNQAKLDSQGLPKQLLQLFRDRQGDLQGQALAGLCLRCYVSQPILQSCQRLASLFSAQQNFTYQELLPFALNDDGQKLILLDEAADSHQVQLSPNNALHPCQFQIFGVEILRSYGAQRDNKLSLKNWAFLKTKQHPEIRAFLSEFGFQHLTDWALLNRARKTQFDQLAPADQTLLQGFHGVYRRDRRCQANQRSKCKPPTEAQLLEIDSYCLEQGYPSREPKLLLRDLQRLAEQLRQYDLWRSRESLETYDAESGDYAPRRDLPQESFDEGDLEQRELQQFLHRQLAIAFEESLQHSLTEKQQQLAKSKRYKPFAELYFTGLSLYYVQAQSLAEIAPQLGMSSWDQARRILNPGDLLNQVRRQTTEKLLAKLLDLARQKGIISAEPEPNYLSSLCQQLDQFVDQELFAEAAAEIRSGKNRRFDSAYAQKLKHYLPNITPN
ncbi:hypothetical protein [Picosynechococcus sp. NKBG15041c]|uniref:hypothetical protein n=1 Tax=Picosynechococcus sp. NKBG15041c TaxID=1407650 RepID=UPI00042A8013|nr:hypothetical protein [Picosynechococcus sp. NKBG15041c]